MWIYRYLGKNLYNGVNEVEFHLRDNDSLDWTVVSVIRHCLRISCVSLPL